MSSLSLYQLILYVSPDTLTEVYLPYLHVSNTLVTPIT